VSFVSPSCVVPQCLPGIENSRRRSDTLICLYNITTAVVDEGTTGHDCAARDPQLAGQTISRGPPLFLCQRGLARFLPGCLSETAAKHYNSDRSQQRMPARVVLGEG
jgi:hypothetical protein